MAELAYTEWETDLQLEINNAESTYPNYDEYRYNVADISHNPYELMAFLTAVYDDFTYSGVESVLRDIFSEQYTLTFTEEIEVRYRTETDTWTDEDGNTHTDTYEVAYNYYILNINLTARSFSDVVFNRMNAEQRERFNVYMITKGNRQYLQRPFGETNWLPYVTSYYGYRVHPITGEKNYHKGLDIGMPEGTEILAGHGGTVTFAGNSGDYGLVVVIEDGDGLVSKYAHCSALLVSAGQTVNAGDLIAKVGNTGQSTGPHLHLEIIKDGVYLNPLYFAVTNDYGQGPTYGDPGTPMGDGSYAALIAEAERYLGYPYVWGGSSPSTSFDCSGYVCWVINQSGVGSVGRIGAQGLYNLCTPVSPSEAQPGDLIFFTGTYSAPSPVTHVGIYVGGGQMIHCGNPISYASINTSYWQSHFYSFGRLN
jgi:murein DD-endopeptidase MepM/ murein hydrolase activator NlpD